MSNEVVVNAENFEDVVLLADNAALVDFWAPWCGPCRIIGPLVEELAAEYGDKITIAKCNVDDNQQLAVDHKVQGIPTLILFANGKEVDRIVGVVQKEKLVSFIAPYVK